MLPELDTKKQAILICIYTVYIIGGASVEQQNLKLRFAW